MLAPGGLAVLSDLVWLGEARPAAAAAFWAQDYPAMRDLAGFLRLVREAGYDLLGHFVLPPADWWESYYLPLLARLDALASLAREQPALRQVAEAVAAEIELYRRHGDSYGYVMAALRRC